MTMFILTSFSCAKARWWCRKVRCRCLPAELNVEQICSVEAETPRAAAALLGGYVDETWDREESHVSIGQWVKYLFTPDEHTYRTVIRTYPVAHGKTFWGLKVKLGVGFALQDQRRVWYLVHVPQLGRPFHEHHAMGHT